MLKCTKPNKPYKDELKFKIKNESYLKKQTTNAPYFGIISTNENIKYQTK